MNFSSEGVLRAAHCGESVDVVLHLLNKSECYCYMEILPVQSSLP